MLDRKLLSARQIKAISKEDGVVWAFSVHEKAQCRRSLAGLLSADNDAPIPAMLHEIVDKKSHAA
jgi:hypothetical protein